MNNRNKPIDGAMTLDRGLRVLALLLDSEEPVSPVQVADHLDMSRQAAYRILGTLCDHHLAIRVGRGKYRYGTGILRLTQKAFIELEQIVRPKLTDLAQTLGAAAHCTVAEGLDAVTLLIAEPPDSLFRFSYQRGSRHPLAEGASGIAILSTRAPVSGEPETVQIARRQGYAVTIGNLTPGAIGIAAPLRDSSGTNIGASIGIVSIDELEIESTADIIIAIATEISASL